MCGVEPELAYFECLHELKLIVDLAYSKGISGMRQEVSDTAEYGDYVSGPKVVDSPSRAAMKEILADIQSGDFARRWIKEARGDRSEFQAFREAGKAHAIEKVGEDLRSRMAWL